MFNRLLTVDKKNNNAFHSCVYIDYLSDRTTMTSSTM